MGFLCPTIYAPGPASLSSLRKKNRKRTSYLTFSRGDGAVQGPLREACLRRDRGHVSTGVKLSDNRRGSEATEN